MLPKLFNNRLILSAGISLLLHLLVFFSLNIFLLFHPTAPQARKVESLEVKLAQPPPPNAQPKSNKKLLTSTAVAPFKMAQSPAQRPPVIVPLSPAPVLETAPPASEEVTGIAFPGAIPTPFAGQGRSGKSLFQARSAPQDAARAYYHQAQDTQTRQRSEFQAQLMTQHLQQMLFKILDVRPLVSGKCQLMETGEGQNHTLKCDSSALSETISNDEKNIVDMLDALRGLGRNFNGFSAVANTGKLNINLIGEK